MKIFSAILFLIFCFLVGVYVDYTIAPYPTVKKEFLPEKEAIVNVKQENEATLVPSHNSRVSNVPPTVESFPSVGNSYIGLWQEEKEYITYDNELRQPEKNIAKNDYDFEFRSDNTLVICEYEIRLGQSTPAGKKCQPPSHYSVKKDIISFDNKPTLRYKW